MARSRREPDAEHPKRPPATTPEARENQLVSLAVELAEKQLREGSATSQVITHYLKLASTREQLEQEKLRGENALLRAKVDSLSSQGRSEEMYTRALNAFRTYAGRPEENDDDDEMLQRALPDPQFQGTVRLPEAQI